MTQKTGKPDYANAPRFKGWLYLKNNTIRSKFR